MPDIVLNERRIFTIRGQAVMLDSDLAEIYEVATGALNQAVDRNSRRFPDGFAFRLTPDEWKSLISQSVISNLGRGGRRKLPRVFTEHGAMMLAAVLHSDRAIDASIIVVDAFVRLRHVLDANRALARKIEGLAAKVGDHDKAFAVVFEELKRLTADPPVPEQPRRRIGFRTSRDPQEKTPRNKRQA
jgi:hypothetical protein